MDRSYPTDDEGLEISRMIESIISFCNEKKIATNDLDFDRLCTHLRKIEDRYLKGNSVKNLYYDLDQSGFLRIIAENKDLERQLDPLSKFLRK